MSNDMLNDDELDAVAGGTNMVMFTPGNIVMPPGMIKRHAETPVKPTTFSNPAANYYASSTAALGSLHSRGTP